MKKQLILIGIAVLFLTVFLTGCTSPVEGGFAEGIGIICVSVIVVIIVIILVLAYLIGTRKTEIQIIQPQYAQTPIQPTIQNLPTRFCQNCGARLSANESYCSNCGNKIEV